MAKRFNPEQEKIDEEWKQTQMKIYTEDELERFDVKLERYNRLRTKQDRLEYYVAVGAARWAYDRKDVLYIRDEKNPTHLLIERVDNKIAQWSDWRVRHGYTARRLMDLDRSSAMHSVSHHDDWGEFDIDDNK